MHEPSDTVAPVGVVPRRRVQAIETLMADPPETFSVAEHVESPTTPKTLPWPQWLSTATTVGIFATAVEWLKLTR